MNVQLTSYVIAASVAFLSCYSMIRPLSERHRGGLAVALLGFGAMLMFRLLVSRFHDPLGVQVALGVASFLSTASGGTYLRVVLPAFRDRN